MVTTLLGGTINIGLLESLLGIDLVDELLDAGSLDVLLDDLLPGGLLNIDVLQALLELGGLDGVLESALGSLGVLDAGFLDLTYFESLTDSGLLDLEDILEFINDSEFDLTLPEERWCSHRLSPGCSLLARRRLWASSSTCTAADRLSRALANSGNAGFRGVRHRNRCVPVQ